MVRIIIIKYLTRQPILASKIDCVDLEISGSTVCPLISRTDNFLVDFFSSNQTIINIAYVANQFFNLMNSKTGNDYNVWTSKSRFLAPVQLYGSSIFTNLRGQTASGSISSNTGSFQTVGGIGVALSSYFGSSVTVQGDSNLNGLVTLTTGITGGNTSRGILSVSELNVGSGGLYTRGLATFGGNVNIFGGRMTVNTPAISTSGGTLIPSQFGLNQYVQYNGTGNPITLPSCDLLANQLIFFYDYSNSNMTINANNNTTFYGSGYNGNASVIFPPFATPILTNNGFSWIVIYKGT